MSSSTYDKRPVVQVGSAADAIAGERAVAAVLRDLPGRVLVVETYPGVRPEQIRPLLSADLVIDVSEAYRAPRDLDVLVADELTDDPTFGRLSTRSVADLFEPDRLAALRARLDDHAGTIALHGTGAALVTAYDVLVYADLARWEIQQRQRSGELGNLGADNAGARAAQLYKRAFFFDWRIADRCKPALLAQADLFLDTTTARPLLVSGDAVRRGLDAVSRRPFRLVPFFDPAPWGGQWMREVCDLPDGPPNYGWCFDCVPEENALLLGFGREVLELPALDLVLHAPAELLGTRVRDRFGDEFPIRFDSSTRWVEETSPCRCTR